MEKQDETKSSHRRRSRRVQQLVGEHAVRRSPRLSRQGMPPSYSLNRSNKRSSRESSVASSISLRSSRASEFLNESGQTLFEESERFDETLLRQASDEPQSSFTREDSRFIRSGIVPSLTESEGAVTLSDGKQQDVSGSDLPIHLYGLDDDDVEVVQHTQYICTKERILSTPPPPARPAFSSDEPGRLSLMMRRLLSIPYLLFIGISLLDVYVLERLSTLVALIVNPISQKRSWFGLLVLFVGFLLFTWWLTLLAGPSVAAPSGMSERDAQSLRTSLINQMQASIAKLHSELLPLLEGNATKIDSVEFHLKSVEEAQGKSVLQLAALAGRADEQDSRLGDIAALRSDIDNVNTRLAELVKEIEGLKKSNDSVFEDMVSIKANIHTAQQDTAQLRDELSLLKSTSDRMVLKEDVTAKITAQLEEMLNDKSGVFSVWLRDNLPNTISKEEFDKLNKTLHEKVSARSASVGGLSEEDIRKIIEEALATFAADHIGKFDYALEVSGGSIPRSHCSETYSPSSSTIRLFGLALWHYSNSPRTVIQASVLPGECWAFKGSKGFVVVRLADDIKISEVSVEHIPKMLSPTNNIASAPKEFEILVSPALDENPKSVGNFTYNGKTAVETFRIKDFDDKVRYVEFRIHSNHGSEEYTCVYRLRVHGMPFGYQVENN